ncbi:glycerol-3-phosphate dehydrogenase mitochondrial-like [Drosophila madeirensis]|uniref:Glycerol-3-phosphate dehydrogenase n=1 Tax=Drosophila madeirensis TaxID=30013 RepID=A0AAU9FF30_DROMD
MFVKLYCGLSCSPSCSRSQSQGQAELRLPCRTEQLKALSDNIFDVLVIGGGATGCGCALDAASRGLKTALLEVSDFSSGSSSKSSKLLHGGLHNLQSALRTLDTKQLLRMYDVLQERALFLKTAPHLVKPVAMVMPIEEYRDLPGQWLLLKLYDLLAGGSKLKASHFLSAKQTHFACPMLRTDNLKGSLVSYELQMDDARLCLALALTAARQGARVANYVQVQQLSPPDMTGIRLVIAKDLLTQQQLAVRATCVINAAGAFVDNVRLMDSKQSVAIARPTAGTHIVLPGYFARSCAVHGLQPGEVFAMPWQGHTLVGCSDGALGLEPMQTEVDELLDKFRQKIRPDVVLSKKHVLSAWKGLWPCVAGPVSRRPLLLASERRLLTIASGDWTNYRAMAEDTLDGAIKMLRLHPQSECCTHRLPLEGARHWTKELPLQLMRSFDLPADVAHHLSESYGTNAFTLLSAFDGCHGRLHDQLPHIEAEVHYAVLFEYALTAVDVLARRMRVAFVDVEAAMQMLPRVVQIMGWRLNWSPAVQEDQMLRTVRFLQAEMGMGTVTLSDSMTIAQAEMDKRIAAK